MKKEWILSEEEKKAKRAKIEVNRQKRKSQPPISQSSEFTYIKDESPETQDVLSPISSMSPLTPQTPGSVGIIPDLPKTRSYIHQPLTPSDSEYSPPAKKMHLDNTDSIQEVLMSDDSFNPETSNLGDSYDSCSVNQDTITFSQDSKSCCSEQSNSRSEREEDFKLLIPKNQICLPSSSTLENLPESVYAKVIEIEFSDLPIRNSLIKSKELNWLEKQKIEELVIANEVLKMPLNCGVTDPSLLDVINMTDHAIRRLIKMSKRINGFKNLCQEDQIALLKGGCTELMILRSVMSYDSEKECWQGPEGPKTMSIKVEVLKEAKGNVYEEHKRFISSFDPKCRTDENIMLILSGIALFTPERPNTVHKEAIKIEQDTYYYLLRRYLDSVYTWCEAKAVYLKLIHKIQELHILNENHVRVYLEVNPKEVEPLLIEIFDLKH